jgi:hypothetical protein
MKDNWLQTILDHLKRHQHILFSFWSIIFQGRIGFRTMIFRWIRSLSLVVRENKRRNREERGKIERVLWLLSGRRERKKNKVVDLLFLGALNFQIPVHWHGNGSREPSSYLLYFSFFWISVLQTDLAKLKNYFLLQ